MQNNVFKISISKNESERVGERVLTSFIINLKLCTAVFVRSAVTGPDSSSGLTCQYTEIL